MKEMAVGVLAVGPLFREPLRRREHQPITFAINIYEVFVDRYIPMRDRCSGAGARKKTRRGWGIPWHMAGRGYSIVTFITWIWPLRFCRPRV